jgi:hypothetical protein
MEKLSGRAPMDALGHILKQILAAGKTVVGGERPRKGDLSIERSGADG